nr:matrin 3-like 1.1 isoform X2 [Scatophagus argus]
MSHNYPYRRLPTDSDLRPVPGPFSSADRRHTSTDNDLHRPPQESFSSSYPSSSRNHLMQDGTLSILNSCGLEPSDLALLAELPEDVLNVESLPQVLKQIKGKRGTVKPFPLNTPSSSSSSTSSSSSAYPRSSAHQPTLSPSTGSWDQPCSQLLQYPKGHLTPTLLSSGLDRWGNPRTTSSVRGDPEPPSSSSSSSYSYHRPEPWEYGKTDRDISLVSTHDCNHRSGLPGYGKADRDIGSLSTNDYSHRSGPTEYGKTGTVLSQDSARGDSRTRPSHFSQLRPADCRSVPPSEEFLLKLRGERRDTESSPIRNSTQLVASIPSKKEALDFHGTTPPVYPYSCSLCAITVMSERVWLKHINGTHHADGQLSLLQRFPNWDCRLETVSRADDQSDKWKDKGQPDQQPQTANQNSNVQPAGTQKKASEKGKVVCVRFPANSVDEAYLRKLAEPFGKIIRILMFPSLAFLELGSIDQAKDLVKFHVNYPPAVNGEQMEFMISSTFSFLQSCQVVSFTPAPSGEYGQSDLISIVKRFGRPLYTLFLPSMAFVEMKNTPDAQKLVDYYSSNTLRINNDVIKVSFSGEYKTLMRVALANRYEEETRSSSRGKEGKAMESKKKKNSTDQVKDNRDRRTRTRSRSRDKSCRDRRTRSKSRDKSHRDRRTRTRSRSRDKSHRDRRTRTRSRSRSRDKSRQGGRTGTRSRSRDKSSRDKRTRTRSTSSEKSSRDKTTRTISMSREKSSQESMSRSSSTGKLAIPKKTEPPDNEFRTSPNPAPVRDLKPEAEEREETEEEEDSSAEESDIEGMEVIGEDGENLEDEDMETLDDAEKEEDGEVEDTMEETAESTDSPEEDKEKEVKNREADDQEQQEEEVTGKEEFQKEEPLKEEQEEPKEEEEEVVEVCGTEKQDTQLQDDQEEPDFPVDLENCITLDELEEDQFDDKDEALRDNRKSSRVVYFRNLPSCSYPDTEFTKLVQDFGTVVRYFHKPPGYGFIEMSTSSEAQRAVKELTIKPVTFFGYKLTIQMSDKYRTLPNGWKVSLDKEKEKRSDCRSQGSSSDRKSRDESSRMSTRRKESPKTTPEKQLSSKKEKKKSAPKTASKKSSEVDKHVSEETLRTTPGIKSATSGEESVSRKTPELQSYDTAGTSSRTTAEKQTEEKEDATENVSATIKTPENESLPSQENQMLNRKETGEDDSAAKKKKKDSSDEIQVKQELESAEAPEDEKMEIQEEEGSEEMPGPGPKDSESQHKPHPAGDPPKPQTEQDSEVQTEQQSRPAGGTTELQKPTKPVGTEFVRPVVGYFCNLCQLIYADEDEAKLQHCSSLAHYRKYQEKTGKDPWAS